MGIRKSSKEKGTEIEMEREGLMVRRVRIGEESWRIVGVYAKKEETLQELGQIMERKERGMYTVIGGNFNVRTGREGGGLKRKSKKKEERWRKEENLRIRR